MKTWGTFYQGANLTVAALVAAHIGWLAIHGGSLELRVIAAALAVTIVASAHDVGLLAQRIDQEGIYLLPYCGMLLFGSFLFAVQRRYVHAINEYDHLSSSLAQRLNERELELQANHVRLLELERAQTLAAERHRLMHDMHDAWDPLDDFACHARTGKCRQCRAPRLCCWIASMTLRAVIDSAGTPGR